MPKTKLLIFDFDGTLIDTAPGIHKAMNLVAEEFSLPHFPLDLIKNLIGYGLNHMLKSLDPESTAIVQNLPKMRQRFLEVYHEISANEVSLFPGILPFLKEAPYLFAIVSNKDQASLRHLVKSSDLNQAAWVAVSGADTFSQKKPHPLPLLETMKLAEVSAEECIMIGDGLPDALSSQDAGVPFIGVNFGYASEEDLKRYGARHILSDYSQLPQFIASIDQSRT